MKQIVLSIVSILSTFTLFAQSQANPAVNSIVLKSGGSNINGADSLIYSITNATSVYPDPSNLGTIPIGALEVTISFPTQYGVDLTQPVLIQGWRVEYSDQSGLWLTNQLPIYSAEESRIAVPIIGREITNTLQATTMTLAISDNFGNVGNVNTNDDVTSSSFNVISTPLPITLVAFGAKMLACNEVNVAWETSSESNVSHYEVEYSTTGNSFVAVAQVAAKNQANTYQTSLFQKESLGFYRLKSVDLDGKYSYSKIAQVQLAKCADAFYKVLPNPSNGLYTLSGEAINGKVQVMDITGKVIYDVNYENLNQAVIDITGFPSGAYHMRVVTSNSKVELFKLIKY